MPASEYRALQYQVRELQRLLGKKIIENEILREALDLAQPKNGCCAPSLGQHAVKAIADALGVARSNLIVQAASGRTGSEFIEYIGLPTQLCSLCPSSRMVAPYAGTQPIPAEQASTAIFVPITNAIEALYAKLRRAVRARDHFPNEAATKLLFLVLNCSEKEWIMPPREWAMAKSQFRLHRSDDLSVNPPCGARNS